MELRQILKSFDFAGVFSRLIRKLRPKTDFFSQELVPLQCGKYILNVPSGHILNSLKKVQPYRDLCIGIAAKYIGEKYPDSVFIDIGANVGDTASMMATYASNKLILIEASDFFYDVLKLNSSLFSNETTLINEIVSNGEPVYGKLSHWGGTAFFDSSSENPQYFQTISLSDVTPEIVSFVKIDTDGFDFGILANGLEYLSALKPAILFENQIHNISELHSSNQILADLYGIGYRYFLVWDDPGILLFSTSSLSDLYELNYYLLKVAEANQRITIYNYDILCLQDFDVDIFKKVKDWFREN